MSVALNRDPLKCVYIEKEPLYASLLTKIQCKRLVFQWITLHSYAFTVNTLHNTIPKVIKTLCFKYTFIDRRDNAWQLLHGRKLKKDKIASVRSISKLLFIEIITGIGMYLCSILHGLKVLFIQYNLPIYYSFVCQILLYFILISTLLIFAMMPTFNAVFYDKLCCKFHNFVEKLLLNYLESKYPINHSNQNNDSYRRSKIIGQASRRNNINVSYLHNDFVDDTILTIDQPSFIATSNISRNIITELNVDSRQKESTIDEKHSLKLSVC